MKNEEIEDWLEELEIYEHSEHRINSDKLIDLPKDVSLWDLVQQQRDKRVDS